MGILRTAMQRRDEEAKAENWSAVQYWCGYIDGVRRAKKECADLWQKYVDYLREMDTPEVSDDHQ